MNWFNAFLILVSFMASFFYLPHLPNEIPMHWNINGQVDNLMPKNIAVWIMPTMSLFIFALYHILPYLDPKKNNYKSFRKEWHIIQTSIIGFLTYMQFITFYIATHPETSLMPLMFSGMGVLFIVIGSVLPKLKQNYFLGIRVPWTLASEDNWNKTHRFGGWCFIAAGVLTLFEAFTIWQAPFVIFGSIFLAAFLPIIYSFLLFKKAESKMRYIFMIIIFLSVILLSARLIAGEDDWICDNGQWVMHGVPSNPKPPGDCF
jgi:uncharacterized membrane protein